MADRKLSSFDEMGYDNSTKVLIPAIKYSSNDPNAQKENRNIPLELFYKEFLFSYRWTDYLITDISWLRADTFTWYSGDSQEVNSYEKVYQHLVDDIDGKTLQSETIAGITIQYYLADDTHKICPATEESNVLSIYNATGMAWYYILDEDNIRFKLPRENPNKELYQATGNLKSGRTNKYITYGIGNRDNNRAFGMSDTDNYFYIQAENGSHSNQYVEGNGTYPQNWSSMYADLTDGTTYNRGKNYLYCFVGNFTKTSIENIAGQNMSVVNQKADRDLHNVNNNIDFIIDSQEPTMDNNYTWYRLYKSGWVEQGGYFSGSKQHKTLPITMLDTHYQCLAACGLRGGINWQGNPITIGPASTTSVSISVYGDYTNMTGWWEVKGKADLT